MKVPIIEDDIIKGADKTDECLKWFAIISI